MNSTYTARVKWYYIDGKIVLTFINMVTLASYSKEYKTQASAKRAETMFINRIASIYGNDAGRVIYSCSNVYTDISDMY